MTDSQAPPAPLLGAACLGLDRPAREADLTAALMNAPMNGSMNGPA